MTKGNGKVVPRLTQGTIRDAIGSAVQHLDSPITVTAVHPVEEDAIVLTLDNGQRFIVCVGED